MEIYYSYDYTRHKTFCTTSEQGRRQPYTPFELWCEPILRKVPSVGEPTTIGNPLLYCTESEICKSTFSTVLRAKSMKTLKVIDERTIIRVIPA